MLSGDSRSFFWVTTNFYYPHSHLGSVHRQVHKSRTVSRRRCRGDSGIWPSSTRTNLESPLTSGWWFCGRKCIHSWQIVVTGLLWWHTSLGKLWIRASGCENRVTLSCARDRSSRISGSKPPREWSRFCLVMDKNVHQHYRTISDSKILSYPLIFKRPQDSGQECERILIHRLSFAGREWTPWVIRIYLARIHSARDPVSGNQ